MSTVTIVIPAYNPKPYLIEAISSARAQTCGNVEIVLVNDGTKTAEGLDLLRAAAPTVDRYIEQPNRGLAAARNTGFRAASSDFVIPLDADDLLEPTFAEVCLAVAAGHPEAAFVYTGCEIFGTSCYVDEAAVYNLYRLLDRNTLTYASLIRRSAWEAAGGYDESMTYGYEDWEFWLRLGSLNRFGRPAPGVLFRYRKHGPSLLDIARSHHAAIIEYIQTKHSGLYSETGRAILKARWEPAVCIVGEPTEQTVQDCAFLPHPSDAPPETNAFLVPDPARPLDPHSGELAVLAVWGGRSPLLLPDGSVANSREDLFCGVTPAVVEPPPTPAPPRLLRTLRSHLENAELLSLDAWLRHPVRSILRLVPLRSKERINRALGREFFDLTFYLRFQPSSVVLGGGLVEPLRYVPRRKRAGRCVALVTPHLGPGGAETVLMDIAAALGRQEFEILLIAVDSRDDRWANRWRQAADHVYDLSALVLPEKLPTAVYSLIVNWEPDTVLIQNSLVAYAVAPHLRKQLPRVRLLDLVHSVDADWDILAATRPVAGAFDLRVGVSETVRERLIESGQPASRTRVAHSGIELERFAAIRPLREERPFRILFAGRLDPVKRPTMLPQIARELRRRRPSADFRFAVAGEGPEGPALAAKVKRAGLAGLFEFHGHVPDIAPLLAECDLLVLPSRAEGVPLVILEAFAAARPVIASSVGAIPEVVNERTGVLVPLGAGEVEAFADGIDRLLQDPEKRRAMGENGRRLVAADYTLEAARRNYRSLFDESLFDQAPLS